MKTIHLTYGALFICLMAIGANITVWFPMLAIPIGATSVPLSLQTFFAILAGFLLGRRLGLLTMLVYIFVGIVGIPVFAGLKAGPMMLFLPTGGFIISFALVTYVVGLLNEKNQKDTLLRYTYISFIGLIINYGFGITYMYLSMKLVLHVDITYIAAFISMVPFFIKDFSLAILAAYFVKRTERLALKNTVPR